MIVIVLLLLFVWFFPRLEVSHFLEVLLYNSDGQESTEEPVVEETDEVNDNFDNLFTEDSKEIDLDGEGNLEEAGELIEKIYK